MDTQYDVVIVGGGWAGSALAYKLALENKKVLVLEAGIAIEGVTTKGDGQLIAGNRGEFMEDFYMAMAKTPESPYAQNYNAPRPSVLDIREVKKYEKDDGKDPIQSINTNGYFIQKGCIPFGSTYERRGGGTSWHWMGTSLRFLPTDFRMQKEYQVGVDWPLSYEDLAKYYEEAEYEIGVSADVKEQTFHGITFSEGYVYPMAKIPPTVLDIELGKQLNGMDWEGIKLQVIGTPAGRNGVPNKMKNGEYYDNGRRQCQGNTNCTPICPIQAKYDATITMKNAVMTGNVDIIYQAVACNIKLDNKHEKVVGIEYKTYEKIDGPAKPGTSVALGKKYIIAANAIEAAKLLLMSNTQLKAGVANKSGQVGKNLMDHPMYLAWGLMPEPVYPFRGPLSTSGIEITRDGPFRKERAAFRIEIGNEGWNWPTGAPYTQLIDMVTPAPVSDKKSPAPDPCEKNDPVTNGLFGSALRKKIQEDFTRQFRIGFLIEQLPGKKEEVGTAGKDAIKSTTDKKDEKSEEIKRCEETRCYIVPSQTYTDHLGIPRPEIHYNFDEYTKKGFQAAARATEAIFKKLGATSYNPKAVPLGAGGKFEYPEGSGNFYYSQGAGHVMGTHRMGSDEKESVTNADLKCWDHDNLYLVGCGSFPTTGTGNPTLTMVALAYKAAKAIVESLDKIKSGKAEQTVAK